MIPHFLQNISPAGRELLRREFQPAQPTSQFYSIGAAELEGWTLQFLTSLADTPSWENTISLVNEHHQTLAHLAVLFRYTTLLKKVAQWGIDVDVQDVNGFTALHCAYLCGDLDSVGVLKGYGADEDIQDTLGRQPLDMYIPSTNDPSRASPSSDHTSRSAQIPTAGEDDWEMVSMAPSQPSRNSSVLSIHDSLCTAVLHPTPTWTHPSRPASPSPHIGSTTSPAPAPAHVKVAPPSPPQFTIPDEPEDPDKRPLPVDPLNQYDHPPPRVSPAQVAPELDANTQILSDLRTLATWLRLHVATLQDPIVGGLDFDPTGVSERLGVKGLSVYTSFIELETLRCRVCGVRSSRIALALLHQRDRRHFQQEANNGML